MRLRPSLTLRSKWERELYEAEANLTDPDIRQSLEKIEQLLHPEFLETGIIGAKQVCVLTAIGICNAGFLSTHVGMMDGIRERALPAAAL